MSTTSITGPGVDTLDREVRSASTPLSWAQVTSLLTGDGVDAPAVSQQRALQMSAVWACIRIVSSSIARMPLVVYRRNGAGRERATDHPLYELLRMRHNPDTSAYSNMYALVANCLLGGNGYLEVVRTRDRQRVVELWMVEHSRVPLSRQASETLSYLIRKSDGTRDEIDGSDIVHIRNMTVDGVTGLSTISHARRSITAGLSADELSARFLRNGMRVGGVLMTPNHLSAAAMQNLRTSMESLHAGPENAYKTMILEQGMTYAAMGMSMEDAQFVESAYFRVEEICRWYGVPPHKVQHLLRSTNNNIEQQSLDFLGDTLSPWVEAIQQELNWKLFTPAERKEYYCEFLTQAIVQLDSAAKVAYYKGLHGIGSINDDEIRSRENLNELPEKRGQTFWVPSNMMPAPTPEQADNLLQSWIDKGAKSQGPEPVGVSDQPGQPNPQTDDKVAKTG
jgi:HK97 family phage portal protein